jgi:hypothetical protein
MLNQIDQLRGNNTIDPTQLLRPEILSQMPYKDLMALQQQFANLPQITGLIGQFAPQAYMRDAAQSSGAKDFLQRMVAQTDIIDSQGQKVMQDAGVGTIAHPEFENQGQQVNPGSYPAVVPDTSISPTKYLDKDAEKAYLKKRQDEIDAAKAKKEADKAKTKPKRTYYGD